MAPNAHGIWTPRSTTKKFPMRVSAPKIHYPYKPPKPPRHRMTIEECMTHEGAETLERMAKSWLEEAARLERETPVPTFEQEIGDVLVVHSVRIKELLQMWSDVLADGTIHKGEFRVKIKSLKPDAINLDVDALFDQYDEDRSGQIDADELKEWFTQMQIRAKQARIDIMVPRERAARLRVRAASAQEAAAAVAHAERLESELEELKLKLEGTLDVQLGLVLVKRKIRVGEVVGEWAVSRRSELTKAEFRENVRALLPTQPGSPRGVHANAEIDALFNSLDADKSGYLDVREAKAALKALQDSAAQAMADKEAKASQAARVRRKASKKTQAALNPEGQADPAALDGIPSMPLPGSPGTDSAGDSPGTSRLLGMFGGMFSEEKQKEKEKEAERKKAAAHRAQQALARMGSMHLTKGWTTWHDWYEHRLWQLQTMRKSLGRIQNAQAARALVTWQEVAEERARRMKILHKAMHNIAAKDLIKGMRGWKAFVEDRHEGQRLLQVAARASAKLKSPMLVAMYDHWHQEQRLAAMERGDLKLGGVSLVGRLCAAAGMAKCVGA